MPSSDEEYSSDEKYEEESNSEQSSEEPSESEADEEPADASKVQIADDDFRQMSFEELLQLKRRLGSKVYNEAVFGRAHKGSKTSAPEEIKQHNQKKIKRAVKNESDSDGPPEELTAKRKVPALGVTNNRKEAAQSRFRDPRFDAKQGYYNSRKFREQYGFINDLRTEELSTLKKQLEDAHEPEEAEQLKFAIRRTENQILEFNKQKIQDKKRKEEKLLARKAVDEGKRPFYEKNSTKRARELVDKFDKLKEEGKIGKHIDKRKRKVTAKDRKKLDFAT